MFLCGLVCASWDILCTLLMRRFWLYLILGSACAPLLFLASPWRVEEQLNVVYCGSVALSQCGGNRTPLCELWQQRLYLQLILYFGTACYCAVGLWGSYGYMTDMLRREYTVLCFTMQSVVVTIGCM